MAEATATRLVLISGLSGSGKSTVGHGLKLRGYDVLDNDTARFQTWGHHTELKPGASVFWLFGNPPRWHDLGSLRREGETRIVVGWYPGIFAELKHFDAIYYLSTMGDLKLLVKRMAERAFGAKSTMFGTTDGQVATVLVSAIGMDIMMRVLSVFDKRIKILDARKPPETSVSSIATDLNSLRRTD